MDTIPELVLNRSLKVLYPALFNKLSASEESARVNNGLHIVFYFS